MSTVLSSLAQLIHPPKAATPPLPAQGPIPAQVPAAQPPPAQNGASDTEKPFDMLSNPQAYAAMLTRNGAPAQYVIQRVQGLVDYQKELAGLNATQLDQQTRKYALAGNAMAGYLDHPTEENWETTKQLVAQTAPDVAQHLAQFQTPPTEAQLAPLVYMTGAHAKLLDNAKTQADTRQAAATAGKTEAETPGAAADSEEKAFKLSLLKNAANGGAPDFTGQVRSMTVFQGHPHETQDAIDAGNAAYKAALASGDPLKAATDANTAVQGVANRLREVSPGVSAGKANEAKLAQQATQPGRVQEAGQIARINLPVEQAKASYQNALNQGDKATADYASTITDSRQTVATAQTIHHIIDLAQSDNATAGAQLKALIPEFTNAIQDIKRPGNAQSSEIASTLEKAKGEIESGVGLSPVTAKALGDIRPYVDTVANGAVSRANAQIDATNTAYGKKFTHETLPVQYLKNAQGHVIVTRDGGQTYSDAKTGEAVK